MRNFLVALCAAAFALTAGCATFKPADPRDDIVALELAFFGALVTIDQFADAGALTAEDAQLLKPIVEAVQESLLAAHAIFDAGRNDFVAAAQHAESARQKIREISAWVRQKKAETPFVSIPVR